MNSPLQRHSTDVVAFLFGITFLALTAMAIVVQSGSLADASSRGWVAGAVLITAGVIAVAGTLVTGLRRSDPGEPGGPATEVDKA